MPYDLGDTNAELARIASKLNTVRSTQAVQWTQPGGMPRFARSTIQRHTGAPLRPSTHSSARRAPSTPALDAARLRIKVASSSSPWGASAAEYGRGGRENGVSLLTGPLETKPEAKPTKHPKFCGAPNDIFIDWRYKDRSLDMVGRPSTAQKQLAGRKRWVNQQLAYDAALISDLEAKLAKFDARRDTRRAKGAAALAKKRAEEIALRARFALPGTSWCKPPAAVGSCLGEESVQGKLYPLASIEDTLMGFERSVRDDGSLEEEGGEGGGSAEELGEEDTARQAADMSLVLRSIQAKLHGSGAMLRITDVFRDFDTDFSGTIEIGELRRALQHLGVDLSERDFELVRPMFDLNGDGVVDYAEFDKIMKRELVKNPRRASHILRAEDFDRPYTPESMQNAKGGSWGKSTRWEDKSKPGSAGSDGEGLTGFSAASDTGLQHSKMVAGGHIAGGAMSRAAR